MVFVSLCLVTSQRSSLYGILTCHESVLLILEKHKKSYYMGIHSFSSTAHREFGTS